MVRTGLLFLAPCLVVLVSGACGQPAMNPGPEGLITVWQSGGAGMLIAECGSRDYISRTADYIVEGTVEKVETRWNEEKTSILTYTDLSIAKYLKGASLPADKLQIVTPGGRVGEMSQWVEDQPIFHEGKEVRVYFQGKNGEFSIVCARFGVEEIGPGPYRSEGVTPGAGPRDSTSR